MEIQLSPFPGVFKQFQSCGIHLIPDHFGRGNLRDGTKQDVTKYRDIDQVVSFPSHPRLIINIFFLFQFKPKHNTRYRELYIAQNQSLQSHCYVSTLSADIQLVSKIFLVSLVGISRWVRMHFVFELLTSLALIVEKVDRFVNPKIVTSMYFLINYLYPIYVCACILIQINAKFKY